MDWKVSTAVIAVLFDGASTEVQWSASIPSSLPSSLREACVRRFASARSMSRAFFPHWNAERSKDDVEWIEGTIESVEDVVCDDDTILTAAPIAGNPRLLFGVFVHCSPDKRPDMRFLAPALLNAGITVFGAEERHMNGLDTSLYVECMDTFWTLLVSISTEAVSTADSNEQKSAQYVMHTLKELASLYQDFNRSSRELVDGCGPPRIRDPVPTSTVVLDALRDSNASSWFQACCILRVEDGSIIYYEGMQSTRAHLLSWYFDVLCDGGRFLDGIFENIASRRVRAWIRHHGFVLCLDAMRCSADQRHTVTHIEADDALLSVSMELLSDPESWRVTPQRMLSSESSSSH